MAERDDPMTIKKSLSKIERQRLFLQAYAEHANVTLAARAAHIPRQRIYEWLEHDERFSLQFNQAKEEAKDTIRAEIYRRGVEGWDEAQFSAGKRMGTIRKYSDTLLIFHAKMLMPEYREKSTVDVNTTTKTVEIYKVRIPDNGRSE